MGEKGNLDPATVAQVSDSGGTVVSAAVDVAAAGGQKLSDAVAAAAAGAAVGSAADRLKDNGDEPSGEAEDPAQPAG